MAIAKAIYSIDLFLLKGKINRELGKNPLMTDRQASLLEKFVKFVCLVYIKWWIRCPLPAEAGISNLELLSRIRSLPDELISKAVEKAFHNHLWYISEQAPASLFSSLLTIDKKEDIHLKLCMIYLNCNKNED